MARLLTALLVLMSLALLSSATEHELVAHITSATSLDIANCGTSGPSRVTVTIFVENPLSQLMAVNYEFFNNDTNSWQSGGKLCNLAPGEFIQCTGTVELTLGGKGNSTFAANMIRLTGTSDAAPSDAYTKRLSFTIRHFTSDREQTMLDKKRTQDASFAELQGLCTAHPTCCMQAQRDSIDTADGLLLNASSQISSCRLADAYSTLISAESILNSISQTIGSCAAAATPTPSQTQTATPTRTPTPSPTGSPQAGAGICPLGIGILFSAIGLAAFFKKG